MSLCLGSQVLAWPRGSQASPNLGYCSAGLLARSLLNSAPGISQSLRATGIAPAAFFAQVMEFACRRDHIVGRRPHGRLERTAGNLCRKHHWSRSLRMIGTFASP